MNQNIMREYEVTMVLKIVVKASNKGLAKIKARQKAKENNGSHAIGNYINCQELLGNPTAS